MQSIRCWFNDLAKWASHASGRPLTFMAAVGIIVIWAVTGPIFDFNDTWQLVINTGTTIITFLMVFLIQNTQNRDTAAMHIKLDELIRSTKGAQNVLLDLEEHEEEDIERIRKDYEQMATTARNAAPGLDEATLAGAAEQAAVGAEERPSEP